MGSKMLVSTKGRYALQLAIYVARAESAGTVAVRYVAEAEQISVKYLEQLARALVEAGVLQSVRGKGGGYKLARPAEELTAGDVLRAVEGSTVPVACQGIDASCPRIDICSTVDFWIGLDNVIEGYVDGITLEQLAFPQGRNALHGWLG